MAEKTGREIPEELQFQNRPELSPGLFLYYQAFHDLGTCRPIGFGVGPIPFTAVVAWMEENEVYGEQRDRGFVIIKRMDSAFMDHVQKKQDQEESRAQRG